MNMTHYQVLGVNENADDAAIKNAFRRLAKKYHPDVNANNPEAEKKFKDVNEAYRILSDPAKRREYDESLRQPSFGAANGRRSNTRSYHKTKQAKSPFDSMNFNGNFDDIWGVKTEFSEGGEKKKKTGNSPDFMNVNQQFANFFGFKPK